MNFEKKLITFNILFILIGACLVLLFVSLINPVGASSAMWSQTYGANLETEHAYSLVETSDGGYALAGYATSDLTQEADFCLVKTDSNGNMQWRKTYGSAKNYTDGIHQGGLQWEIAYSLVETSDAGYALAGYAVQNETNVADFWLIKTDTDGNMQWNQTYGGSELDSASALVETSDGGYALAGHTMSFGEGHMDLWVLKTDSNGNMQWNILFGGTGDDRATAIVEMPDGGFGVGGFTTSFGHGSYDYLLIKIDKFGTLEWNQTYGGTEWERPYSLIATSDGGYALGGETSSFGAGNFDFWIVKTDTDGNMLWNQTYGRGYNDSAESLVQTSDEGYALAGFTVSLETADDFWLIKTDPNGNMEWNQTYGGTRGERAYSLIECSDGGYGIAGYTSSFGASGTIFWLVKTDEYGVVPEFPSWALLPIFLIITTVVILYKKKMQPISAKDGQIIFQGNNRLSNLRISFKWKVFFIRTCLFFGENYKAHLSSKLAGDES